MFCPKCGKQIKEGTKFCTGCGNPIAGAAGSSNKEMPKPAAPVTPTAPVTHTAPAAPAAQVTRTAPVAPAAPKKKSNNIGIIILIVVFVIFILAAIGGGAYYFLVLRTDSIFQDIIGETVDESEEYDDDDKFDEVSDEPQESGDDQQTEETVEAEPEAESAEAEPEAEPEPEEEGVVSDTNEVVNDVILENIPKALYSYNFNDSLGNAKAVKRDSGDTMPEIDPDIEPQYVPGMSGKAVYLDGSYGIWLEDVSKLGGSYTVAFWMKADELYDWVPYIHIGSRLLDGNNRCRLWIGQKTASKTVAPIISSEKNISGAQYSYELKPGSSSLNRLEPELWYHIAFTVDGNTRGSQKNAVHGTLYVAGQYINGGDIASDIMNDDELFVHLGINCWDKLYSVAFDEVKIWDQCLTEEQISELYNAY